MDNLSLPDRMLEPLGLTNAEEDTYMALLKAPSASPAELAQSTGLGPSKLRSSLKALEQKGLVSKTPGKSVRYMASPPEVALELLVLNRQEELERIRLLAPSLAQDFRRARKPHDAAGLVEVIEGRNAVVQRVKQLEKSAKSNVNMFDTPPHVSPPGVNREELHALSKGVAYRTIYSHAGIHSSQEEGNLTVEIEAGEQARVLEELPVKMMIVDDETAVIPLIVSGQVEAAAIIHRSPLLDALIGLFETKWARAIAVTASGDATTARSDASDAQGPSGDERELLRLLLAGLKDEVIAKSLGLDVRTVRRRIARILDVLDANSRFQAGVQASRKGWV